MNHKSILTGVIGLFLASVPFDGLAQQDQLSKEQRRAYKANLLINHTNPGNSSSARDRNNNRPQRRAEFRTIDGTNNNIRRGRTDWGASATMFRRIFPAAYGAEDPSGALNSDDRPSPREISNVVCNEPETIFTARLLNALGYQWGQFLDHDITFTPTGNEYAPIPLPGDEEIFTAPIPFNRSEFEMINSQREQLNLNTAYIDGSMIYGSDEVRAAWLRTFTDGKLKTSEGDFLPYNTLDGEITGEIDPNAPVMDDDNGKTVKTFVAGDVRASENPNLTGLHTVFLREHNRLCDLLIAQGLTDDEEIYQIARKYVGALVQSITYNQHLPSLGLRIDRYRGYRSNVPAAILNIFATAAFRLGHTQVSDEVLAVDDDCQWVGEGEFELVDTFFNPTLFAEYGVDAWLKGATVHELYETNLLIDDALRNFLFGNLNDDVRFGLDLASINIQRGRDHGLPDYNTIRKRFTGRKAEQFSDISSVDSVATGLESLYDDIEKVDAWVGLLAEDLLPNSSLGRTVSAIWRTQFENLRDGDFYYYQNDPFLSRRTKIQIARTTLSDVIHRNTDLTSLDNVFFLDPCLPEEEELAAKIDKDITEIALTDVGPNPFNNQLNIAINNDYQHGKIDIYAINGTHVLSRDLDGSTAVQINSSQLENGLYIAKLTLNLEVNVFKLVKNSSVID